MTEVWSQINTPITAVTVKKLVCKLVFASAGTRKFGNLSGKCAHVESHFVSALIDS